MKKYSDKYYLEKQRSCALEIESQANASLARNLLRFISSKGLLTEWVEFYSAGDRPAAKIDEPPTSEGV